MNLVSYKNKILWLLCKSCYTSLDFYSNLTLLRCNIPNKLFRQKYTRIPPVILTQDWLHPSINVELSHNVHPFWHWNRDKMRVNFVNIEIPGVPLPPQTSTEPLTPPPFIVSLVDSSVGIFLNSVWEELDHYSGCTLPFRTSDNHSFKSINLLDPCNKTLLKDLSYCINMLQNA